MKRWIVIGLFAAFVALAAGSAEARGGRPSYHHRPSHRSHVSFGFRCWPSYRSSYIGIGYRSRGWSVGLSCWPSYRSYSYVPSYSSYYYAPTYPAVYSYGYTYPTYTTSYPATTTVYPSTYTSYRTPDPPPPPQPQAVQGWYHPTYGFWCPCHGYQKTSLANHSYQYDTTKDAKP